MFSAFSRKLNRNVSVNEVYDLDEIFTCTNPRCGATFKIRSPEGKRLKHFYHYKGAVPHVENCFCDIYSSSRYHISKVEISSIEEIFENSITNEDNNSRKLIENQKAYPKDLDENSKVFVRTPKQLLKFCLSNTLDTVYHEDKTINDIFVDGSNVHLDRKYEGVQGIRLIVGETIRYDKKQSCIFLQVVQKGDYKVLKCLKVQIVLPQKLLEECRKYITSTLKNNKFKGYQLAILADWTIKDKYNIKAEIRDKKHLIYK
jgi:hypothetical protein